MQIYSESKIDQLIKVFSGQDIQTGNPYIDQQLLIKGEDKDKIVQFFSNDETNEAIIQFVKQHNGNIIDGEARIRDDGAQTNETHIVSRLKAIANVVHHVNKKIK